MVIRVTYFYFWVDIQVLVNTYHLKENDKIVFFEGVLMCFEKQESENGAVEGWNA